MTLHIKLNHLAAAIVVVAVLVGGGYALASTGGGVISACIHRGTRLVSIPASGHCGKGYTAISWNQRGVRGAQGAQGATGARGAAGTAGSSASVRIGTVTTGSVGSQASVTNSGTGSNAILNFSIPQGPAGQDGAAGVATGPTAYGQIWMWNADAGLAPGDNSQNIVDEVPAGGGVTDVYVQGCSSAGLTDPVINVTADKDPANQHTGRDDAPNAPDAYVSSWSTDVSLLVVTVVTTDQLTGAGVNSDFSISVIC